MKKNTLYVLFVFLTLQVHAQLTNGNFTTEIDERFKNVSKAPITSNILIDRVFPAANIQEFNQERSIDTSSVGHFQQAWSELYRASYIKNFTSLATLKAQLTAKKYPDNTIPIGIINTEFHQCNFGTTLAEATVSYNTTTGLFANKTNKIPFVKKQTTVIAPLVDKVTGASIRFVTDDFFVLQKYGKTIKKLTVTTNNTTAILINNYVKSTTDFTTNYRISGEQVLKFVVTFNDNSTKTTYATLLVVIPTTYLAKGRTSELEAIEATDDLLFQGYDETQSYRGKNEYRIYYDTVNGDEVVNKPFYIIDGYDPDDSRKIEDFDLGHSSEKSIVDLMRYGNGNFIEVLNSKGYDVIIINHPVYITNGKEIDGGSDYIERNAYTFISLLRYIKSIQQGNEEAVVVGPSMGGLISRYALAYMEKQYAATNDEKWNHNTRLWVSFDSPHQGANIPIGVQKGIQYFADVLDVEAAKTFINEELNKPAPKQMLVNHYTNNTNLPVGAPNFRNRFQSALDNLGMPQSLRKIALLNGAINGKLNGVSGDKYLGLYTSVGVSLGIVNSPLVSSSFFHNTNKKSGNSNNLVFYSNEISANFFGFKITILKGKSVLSAPSSKGSYDIASGSTFNAHSLLADDSESDSYFSAWGTNLLRGMATRSYIFDPTHTFIPSKSALAYTGSNVLDENISEEDRVCTNQTPFDGYYAPEENEEHIYLTNENVNWLTKEIDGIEQSPSITINPLEIEGAYVLCNGQIETYTIDAPTSCGGDVTWTVTEDLYILSQTNNSVTVTNTGNDYRGAAGISVEVIGSTTEKYSKDVWIGKPLEEGVYFSLSGTTQLYTRQWATLQSAVLLTPYTFDRDGIFIFENEWSIPNSQIRYSSDKSTATIYPLGTGTINIGLRTSNICGCTDWFYRNFSVSSTSTGGGDNTILTPAPR